MEITHQTTHLPASVSSIIPDDLVSAFSNQVLTSIEIACTHIDQELHKIKSGLIEIGKSLHSVHLGLKSAVDRGQATELFEKLVEHRFGKKKSWAYQLITIYQSFNESDPLIETCSASVLRHFIQLEPSDLDLIRGSLEAGGTLTDVQARSLVKIINSQRAGNLTIEEMQEQIAQVTAKTREQEKVIEAREASIIRFQKELQNSEESKERLMSAILEKTERETNLLVTLNKTRQDLEEEKAKAEEERRIAKTRMATVEVEVAPAGYINIATAIQAIEETLAKRNAELEAVNTEIKEKSLAMMAEDAISERLMDMHRKSADIARVHLEIVTTSRPSDLEKYREMIESIAQTCNKVSADLLRQFA